MSDVSGTVTPVQLFTFTAADYLGSPLPRPAVLASTGIADLDHCTGGVRSGDVWVITGPARSGRSTLVVQLSAKLAEAGTPVRFFLGRDPIQEVAARLSALTRLERLYERRAMSPTLDEPWSGWALDFVPQPDLQTADDWSVLPSAGPCALVVEDLDLWRGDPLDFLPLARAHARGERCCVIVTVPDVVIDVGGPNWQRWVRGADVIVALEPRLDDYTTLRLLSHRTGPTAAIDVLPYFEQARFESPTSRGRAVPPSLPGSPASE
jgi:hypothetical protein